MTKKASQPFTTEGEYAVQMMAKGGILHQSGDRIVDAMVMMVATVIFDGALCHGRAKGLREAAETVKRVLPDAKLLADELVAQADDLDADMTKVGKDFAALTGRGKGKP